MVLHRHHLQSYAPFNPMTRNPLHPFEPHHIAGHHATTLIFEPKTHNLQSLAPHKHFPPSHATTRGLWFILGADAYKYEKCLDDPPMAAVE